jgi:ATP-binding cassette subfamily C protein EexD|tara:strand:+ start:32039 stop:32164 length:126 start_codon:yes stop_codon:yes gene_type:complete
MNNFATIATLILLTLAIANEKSTKELIAEANRENIKGAGSC